MQLPVGLLPRLEYLWAVLFDFVQFLNHKSPNRLVWHRFLLFLPHTSVVRFGLGCRSGISFLLLDNGLIDFLLSLFLLLLLCDVGLESSYFVLQVDYLLVPLIVLFDQLVGHLLVPLSLHLASFELGQEPLVIVYLGLELILGFLLFALDFV